MESTIGPALSFVQAGYIVNDLRQACQRFRQQLGIGPFFLLGRGQTDVTYHGDQTVRSTLTAEVALAQSGDLQIELIALHSEGPSAFRDTVPAGTEGLHHMAAFTSDYVGAKQRYLQAGHRCAMEMTLWDGHTLGYFDTSELLGHMVELTPDIAPARELHAATRNGTAEWDGRDLFIELAW
jgi:hypothetical protein